MTCWTQGWRLKYSSWIKSCSISCRREMAKAFDTTNQGRLRSPCHQAYVAAPHTAHAER